MPTKIHSTYTKTCSLHCLTGQDLDPNPYSILTLFSTIDGYFKYNKFYLNPLLYTNLCNITIL